MGRINTWLESHLARHSSDRPLVSLCYAQSLDGSLAVACGQPLALSGAETSLLTHRLRAMHGAILIGIGTVLADDPRLTVRLVDGANPQPIILDSDLETPLACFLVQAHPRHPWIFAAADASKAKFSELEAACAQITCVPRSVQVGLELSAVLAILANRGIKSIMVEGGARVISSFLAQNLVDLAIITIAPLFVGGLPVLEQGMLSRSGSFPRLVAPQIEAMGDDCVIFGEVSKP